MYKRARLGIGYLPQEASIFRKLSVEDNIMAVLEMTKLNKKDRKENGNAVGRRAKIFSCGKLQI
jgi:lipopolysaccharide export system ATP-binding protein